jgi:3-deoxy-D-manno-octulosonic-acid transferase
MPASPTAPGRATAAARAVAAVSGAAEPGAGAERDRCGTAEGYRLPPERVSVAGNLKFDVRAAEEAEATRQLKASGGGVRLVVAGSTLEGEEAALLEAWPRLLEADPQLAMVLAPRHPERFAAVAALLDQSGFRGSSARIGGRRPAEPARCAHTAGPGEIVLLDTIGELASVYSLAAVAFVGGSLVPAGGTIRWSRRSSAFPS